MANLTKSADVLIAEISTSVKSDLYQAIEPIAKRIMDAVSDLQKALGSGKSVSVQAKPASAGKRRGRPPKGAAKARPAAAVAAVAVGKKGPRKRGPRGALQAEVRSILRKSGAMKISQLRDEILKSSTFKGRDPKSLYTQIVQAINKSDDISKTAQGTYRIK